MNRRLTRLFALLCTTLAVTLAGCYSTGGSDDDDETVCLADAADAGCEEAGPPTDAGPSEPDCSTGSTGGKCNAGSRCSADAECATGACGASGRCVEPTCNNGMQDEEETGPDCGGPCPACAGEACSRDQHCKTGYCKGSVCAAPSCTDNEKNGRETGVDCGGDCGKCAVGSGCRADADCKSGICKSGQCADPPANCSDGKKNGSETDVDCGGPECGACAIDRQCSDDGDCLTDYCHFGACKEATCSDGNLNQGESDTDCGGPNCAGCADGKKCSTGSDCDSGRCTDGRCTSCSDGIQNGDEGGVDCGGSMCGACDDGSSCRQDSDCGGGRCKNGTCCTPNACGFCGELPDETCNGRDDDCDGQVDEQLYNAPRCPKQKGVCSGAYQKCMGSRGWKCPESAYKDHDSDYSTEENPCDGVDNDCDGEVDETSCPDDGNPCTETRCMNDACQTTTKADGTSCANSAPNRDLAILYTCYKGQCQLSKSICDCTTSGDCRHYYYTEHWQTGDKTLKSETLDVCRCVGTSQQQTCTYRVCHPRTSCSDCVTEPTGEEVCYD